MCNSLVEEPYKPVPVQSPARALQHEQALFDEVAGGLRRHAIHIWRAESAALAVPRHVARLPGFGGACDYLRVQGWPVVCRITGGDAVPLTAGVLNIAVVFVLPQPAGNSATIAEAYDRLCRPIMTELSALGLSRIKLAAVAGAFCDGAHNITIGGRKVAGTAQRWRRMRRLDDDAERFAVLAHAALIVDDDLTRLVEMTNRFYHLCGIERRCRLSSHGSVAQSLRRRGLNPPEDLHELLAGRLASAYAAL